MTGREASERVTLTQNALRALEARESGSWRSEVRPRETGDSVSVIMITSGSANLGPNRVLDLGFRFVSSVPWAVGWGIMIRGLLVR